MKWFLKRVSFTRPSFDTWDIEWIQSQEVFIITSAAHGRIVLKASEKDFDELISVMESVRDNMKQL